MPELPEVDTIRAGLARWITDRTIRSVEVRHPRAVRRHPAGAEDLAARLAGLRVEAVSRRGKYLWLVLDGPTAHDECLIVHLGMSGQLLLQPQGAPDERHLHVRIRFEEPGPELRFVDQRTFGGMFLDRLVPPADAPHERVPALVAHIARDPLDPLFDDAAFVARLRRRASGLKRALLDQSLISGIGNIYADESLWRAGLHGERRADGLTRAQGRALLSAARDVLQEARAAGGTSFDTLYVDVDGDHGYFARELNVYGRADEPCRRCGTAVRRAAFMNRSSFFCPSCQRPPRTGRI
jgi:formamidopyrimidine-DNA glycosylase